VTLSTFTPTHVITLVLEDGGRSDVEVHVVGGLAYTRTEWLAGCRARWRVEQGEWTWCGLRLPHGCVEAIVRDAAATAAERPVR
jgi:hypothetical protein